MKARIDATALEPEELEITLLPCPVCKTDKWMGLETVYLTFSGERKPHMEKMFFCSQCGIHAQPSSMPSFHIGYWNRLVRRIQSGDPTHQ